MAEHSLTFDAIAEARPGRKWAARWSRSWPAYETWFLGRGGREGPSRGECEAALAECMPELVPTYRRLIRLAGGGDLAARFLSTWCPPRYLGGCSIASLAGNGAVRLVRNYDLSPELNEGLLLRTEWTGMPLMGMVEFLWGLSDGVNAAGLSAALAYGGRREVGRGFGATTIVRYVLETCETVAEALKVLKRLPSHMAYNITIADRHGASATAELEPGGGARVLRPGIATNHQQAPARTDRAGIAGTHERRDCLQRLIVSGTPPEKLADSFLEAPLYQRDYSKGFGTLFTAVYDPVRSSLTLRWPGQDWPQTLDAFAEGQREITYRAAVAVPAASASAADFDPRAIVMAIRSSVAPATARELKAWAAAAGRGEPDWAAFGLAFACAGNGELVRRYAHLPLWDSCAKESPA